MKQVYQIKEYGSFYKEQSIAKQETEGMKIEGYKPLPENTFEQLENFILTNRSKDTDALELMGISFKRGIGKVITAKNYVGIICMKDGTTIEILPKIYVFDADKASNTETQTKKLLVEMLKTLRNAPYKSLQTANVNLDKMTIFEVFIRMFVDEVFYIVKHGLKWYYESVEENEPFFKGKMKFSQQIKFNYIHKERNYVEYDAFTNNRPENRLLKATLCYLHSLTRSAKNKNDLKTLLNAFDGIDASTDYNGDFAKYVPDRHMKDYSTALIWSKIFLMGKSFTSYVGSEVALALLFPMETLFECYIAAQLKSKLSTVKYAVSTQDKSYHLFDLPCKKFLMKPDIVVTRKSDHATFVLDTKWKMLSGDKANYGISQVDMYQMYAYQKKYEAENITLLYPMTDTIAPNSSLAFSASDGANVNVRFVDLFNVHNSLASIVKLFYERNGTE